MAHPRHHDLSTERVVLDQFIAGPRWSRAGLHVKLEHIDPGAIDGTLVALLLEGLLIRDGAQEWLLAPAVRHLAALGLLRPESSSPTDDNGSAIDRVLARQALQDYARRREADRDPQKIVQELPALVDRGIAAGLDPVTVSALAEGRTKQSLETRRAGAAERPAARAPVGPGQARNQPNKQEDVKA
jgi:hypothetical protein